MIDAFVERRTSLQHLITALNLLTLDSSQRFFVGISGFPGGGKSTLAKELCNALIAKGYDVLLVNQDDFRIAKHLRYRKDGSLAYAPLPLINQWHHSSSFAEIPHSYKKI